MEFKKVKQLLAENFASISAIRSLFEVDIDKDYLWNLYLDSFPEGTNLYYAHHQWKYGTQIEAYEIDLIKRYFPHAKIFNPSTDLLTKDKDESVIMSECLNQVRNSDILVYSSVDGCVGVGVYTEVMEAKRQGKIVFYIYQDQLRNDFELIERFGKERTDRLYAKVSPEW